MTITLSPAAADQLHERTIRIAFTTGCSGSGYRLSFAGAPLDGDEVIHVGDARVALDSMAASHLDGAEIDYHADEDAFLLDHPDAVTAVWCG